ncbi:MAG: PRC-barrel domain containing protein [Rhodospirillales bacterium]|nr:MAG: PRC-barrel domain containing protein [Rhodospirillales bacterium]
MCRTVPRGHDDHAPGGARMERTRDMKTMLIWMAAVLAGTLIAAPRPAAATEPDPQQPAAEGEVIAPVEAVLIGGYRMRRLIEAPVHGPDDSLIGTVYDVIVDQAGEATFVVVSLGDPVGLPEKRVPVAFGEITVTEDNRVELPYGDDVLRARPAVHEPEGFDIFVPPPAETAEDRRRYLEQAERQVERWGDEVERLAEEAEATGEEFAAEAAERVDQAWSVVRERWQRLRDAGEEAWRDARQSFDEAWSEFQERWQDAEPEAEPEAAPEPEPEQPAR